MENKTTQSMIARQAQISPTHLTLILKGVKRPSWKAAKRLATATNTSPVFWMDAPPDMMAALIERLKGCTP